MKPHHELVMIGAGPAGMAGAVLAAGHGASVLLLDEQSRPGGQIYRGIEVQSTTDRTILGEDYYRGAALVDRLRASAVNYVPGATVWHLSPDREIGVTIGDQSHLLTADQVIIANGAQERPFPVEGWTLPGVMTAGAAQILLKTSGVTLPDAVFVGTGPLLYLAAHQYMRAGVSVAGILDTTPRANYRRALSALPGALPQTGSMFKGWRWLRELRASGVRFIRNVEEVRIIGRADATGVEYRTSGQWDRIEGTSVLLHQGVVPNVNLAMAAGCKHDWNDVQHCWQARTDPWGLSNIGSIAIAGDGAGIMGATGAEVAGQIAALGALYRLERLGVTQRDSLSAPLRKSLAQQAGFRRFLDALYESAAQFRVPQTAETIVCRCEEVTVGHIHEAIDQGCRGPNQLKSFTRAGMGPCQGRSCGLTISQMIADRLCCPIEDVGASRIRPPVKPLELAQLATLGERD